MEFGEYAPEIMCEQCGRHAIGRGDLYEGMAYRNPLYDGLYKTKICADCGEEFCEVCVENSAGSDDYFRTKRFLCSRCWYRAHGIDDRDFEGCDYECDECCYNASCSLEGKRG